MSRSDIRTRIRQLLPHDVVEQVEQLTDSALVRLTKQAIRHYVKEDEFCLSYEESQRLANTSQPRNFERPNFTGK